LDDCGRERQRGFALPASRPVTPQGWDYGSTVVTTTVPTADRCAMVTLDSTHQLSDVP
jgi:hypothetical protein